MRLKLVVAYDGTDFCGWARQRDQRTVHQALVDGIEQAVGQRVELHGSSRTDSGAHARGQVCHFDTTVDMPLDRWPRVLNKVLRPDVAVRSASVAPDDFHARFWARYRWYRYRIQTSVRDPFKGRYAHHYGRTVDQGKIREAANTLTGTHDFRAFTEELEAETENTVRTLYRIKVRELPTEIQIDVVGTAFMRGMMRRIAGALLEIGRGHRPIENIQRLLSPERDQMQWPVVLPAKGLCLMRVSHGDRAFPDSPQQ